MTDGFKIGKLKLIGLRDLNFYQIEQIKRVRLVRRADGYYAQFCVDMVLFEQVIEKIRDKSRSKELAPKWAWVASRSIRFG